MQTYSTPEVQGTTTQVNAGTERLWSRWIKYLETPIDGASLAIFRMCFGLAVLANTLIYCHRIKEYYVLPAFNFSYIPGLHPVSEAGMYAIFALTGISAVCLALGLFYRASSVLLFLSYTYVFLLEKSYYQNHLYLISLLSFLFCFLPAGRVWSVDNKLKHAAVPRWSLSVLKAQLFLVYFYGGIAKLNYDWLVRKQPMTSFLHDHAATNTWLGHLMTQNWFGDLIAYGGVGLDLSIGFLLWWPPTFWLAAPLAVAFHLTNACLFKIGVFPWLMLATIPLFYRPDWPQRLATRLGLIEKFKAFASMVAPKSDQDKSISGTEPAAPALASASGIRSGGSLNEGVKNAGVLLLMNIFVVIQVLVPLKQFTEPDPDWTDSGDSFCWHMMLMKKDVASFTLTVLDPVTKRELRVPNTRKLLNPIQLTEMLTRPDMILQFAHFLSDVHQRRTGVRPVINVQAIESLNLRRPQPLIDPTVDLANVSESAPKTWIVPLHHRKHKRMKGAAVSTTTGASLEEQKVIESGNQ